MSWEDELEEEVGRLPPEVEPPRDLWPGIEGRLRSEQVEPDSAELESKPRFGSDRSGLWGRGGARRRWGVGLAVAAGLVGLLAGSLLLNAPMGGPARGEMGPSLEEGSLALEDENLTLDDPSSTVSVSAESRVAAGGAEVVQAAFEPELQELRLLAQSQELAPETRAVLDESLATIEAAMEEARTAVEADPYAPRAVDRLRRMYEAKLELFHVMTTQRPPAG